MNNDTGVYAITSPSGKIYIGSATSFKKRWRQHLYSLRRGCHHSATLQAAYLKYGEDSLKFSPLAFCAITDLLVVEQRYIDRLNPHYNICKVAGSRLGSKSPAAGPKISSALRGRKHSETSIRNMSAAQRARPKRQPLSAATRAKLSEALLGNRNNDGRAPASAETRAKLSAAGKGQARPKSAEHRAKIAASLLGKVVLSESARLKISDANKGKPKSPEHRAKIAAAVAETKRRNKAARMELNQPALI